MAQIKDGDRGRERARQMLRQRPWIAGAACVALVLLAASALFGVVQADASSGIEIVRGKVDEVADGPNDGDAVENRASDGKRDVSDAPDALDKPTTIMVDIDGAVMAPGVFELAADSRLQDAILAAGGLVDTADISGVNRASVLVDGQKIHIPAMGEAPAAVEAAADVPAAAESSSAGSGASALVNINTASASELDELPGVGPSTAASIVEDRERNGAFAGIEDLMRVSGIGEKKFEKLRSSICV